MLGHLGGGKAHPRPAARPTRSPFQRVRPKQHLEEGRAAGGGAPRAFVWRPPSPLPSPPPPVPIVPGAVSPQTQGFPGCGRVMGEGPGPSPNGPGRGCFSETDAPQHHPAPTSSLGPGCWLPLVVEAGTLRLQGRGRSRGMGGANRGLGQETWHLPGTRAGGGARAAFGVGVPGFTPPSSLAPPPPPGVGGWRPWGGPGAVG